MVDTMIEFEYDDDGVITEAHLGDMSLEEIQNMMDLINTDVRNLEKSLEVLKKVRDRKVFDRFEAQKVNTFDEGTHTYTRQPKSKISGDRLSTAHKGLWLDIINNRKDLIDISKGSFDKYLMSKGSNPAQRKTITNEVSVSLEDGIRVTKRV